MAKGYKTGGRTKGTPNKTNPLKQYLYTHSTAYYEPNIVVEDAELAEDLHVSVGSLVSRFDMDLAMMPPNERAAIQEKLLRYHTPQMQAVSAEISVNIESESLEIRLARLSSPS